MNKVWFKNHTLVAIIFIVTQQTSSIYAQMKKKLNIMNQCEILHKWFNLKWQKPSHLTRFSAASRSISSWMVASTLASTLKFWTQFCIHNGSNFHKTIYTTHANSNTQAHTTCKQHHTSIRQPLKDNKYTKIINSKSHMVTAGKWPKREIYQTQKYYRLKWNDDTENITNSKWTS